MNCACTHVVGESGQVHSTTLAIPTHRLSASKNFIDDLVQVHCCVAMMNWQVVELVAQH